MSRPRRGQQRGLPLDAVAKQPGVPKRRPGSGIAGSGCSEENQRFGATGFQAVVVDQCQALSEELGGHPDVQCGGGTAIPLQHQVADGDPVRRQLQRDAVEHHRCASFPLHYQFQAAGAPGVPKRDGELPVHTRREDQRKPRHARAYRPGEGLLKRQCQIASSCRPKNVPPIRQRNFHACPTISSQLSWRGEAESLQAE